VVHYDLNKIKLAFDAQYKIIIHTSLTYLVLRTTGLGLENAGLEPILRCQRQFACTDHVISIVQ